MNRLNQPRPGTPLFAALAPLCRNNNPFARVAMHQFEHGRALADAFIAGNTLAEVYACIRLARRYGMLPEGEYLGGSFFSAYWDERGEFDVDEADIEELRSFAWELREAFAELSVTTANVA